jgi:pimeloyl-ACP methyl ester carboxylesterase
MFLGIGYTFIVPAPQTRNLWLCSRRALEPFPKIGLECRTGWPPDSEPVPMIVPGWGWSDPGPAPRTLAQEVFELQALLKIAKISPPFVLVGQSLGAMNVRLFTEQYSDEVVGIVLVDPADENSMLFMMGTRRWMKLRDQARGRKVPQPRERGSPSTGYNPEDDFLGDEARLLYLSRQKKPQSFGGLPLFVLAAGKRPPPPGMTEDSYRDIRRAIDQDRVDAAHLSRNSKFVLDLDSGHNIQLDDPQAVAEAVTEVVEAVNNHTKLK